MSPSSLHPTASGTAFTVTVANATTGAFNFSIQGTDGALTHTQAVSLAVGTDVTWTATGNTSATVAAGQNAIYTFSATPVGGTTFSGAVNFACANLPALANCDFNPPSISAGAATTPVTLTIATTGPNQGTELRRAVPSTPYPLPREKPFPPGTEKIGVGIGFAWLLAIPIAGMMWAGATRRKRARKTMLSAWAILALLWLAFLVACGSLGSRGGATTVSVSPSIASVALAAQQQFSATVVNGNSQAVTWAVNGGDANGAIGVSSGLYTAPGIMPASSSVTVTATSQSDPSASGTATVTLTGPLVTVTVTPQTATTFANEPGNTWPASATQQQFSANVVNGNSQTVTWEVAGGSANGTVDATGLYSAPPSVPNPPSIKVTATSPLTASSGLATVTIAAPTPLGTYSNIQVMATAAGGAAHTDLVTLTVD